MYANAATKTVNEKAKTVKDVLFKVVVRQPVDSADQEPFLPCPIRPRGL